MKLAFIITHLITSTSPPNCGLPNKRDTAKCFALLSFSTSPSLGQAISPPLRQDGTAGLGRGISLTCTRNSTCFCEHTQCHLLGSPSSIPEPEMPGTRAIGHSPRDTSLKQPVSSFISQVHNHDYYLPPPQRGRFSISVHGTYFLPCTGLVSS